MESTRKKRILNLTKANRKKLLAVCKSIQTKKNPLKNIKMAVAVKALNTKKTKKLKKKQLKNSDVVIQMKDVSPSKQSATKKMDETSKTEEPLVDLKIDETAKMNIEQFKKLGMSIITKRKHFLQIMSMISSKNIFRPSIRMTKPSHWSAHPSVKTRSNSLMKCGQWTKLNRIQMRCLRG